MSKRNKVLVGAGAAVLIVGLVVISAGARRERGVEVRFEKAGRRDLVAAVTASGKIQPKKKVDISADITGRITKIAVHEGDLVTKGQFLLQIDPTIYQANLQQAEATYASSQAAAVQAKANRDQADRALGRTKELHTQNPNLVSQEQLEQAQTAFEIAEANLTAAQHHVDQARAAVRSASDNLRKTTLIAPMAGRVTRLSVEEGDGDVPGGQGRDRWRRVLRSARRLEGGRDDRRRALPSDPRLEGWRPRARVEAVRGHDEEEREEDGMTALQSFRTGDTPLPDIVILTHKLARDYDMGGEVVRALRGVSL